MCMTCLFPAPGCETLTNPDNGRVTVMTRTIGSVASYRCNGGFEISGEETRTCERIAGSTSVRWSGVAPTCIPTRKISVWSREEGLV